MSHHLVILKKKYLERILNGNKTIECRFSRIRIAPFQRVRRGDTLWLKQSGGAVSGQARVRSVHFYHPLDPKTMTSIRRLYRSAIQADQDFFLRHTQARYASLIQLSQIRTITPMKYKKNNRQAWVVLSRPPKPI